MGQARELADVDAQGGQLGHVHDYPREPGGYPDRCSRPFHVETGETEVQPIMKPADGTGVRLGLGAERAGGGLSRDHLAQRPHDREHQPRHRRCSR